METKIQETNYYTIIPDKLLTDESISHAEFRVYCAVVSLTKIHGYCYASNEYIGNMLNMAQSTVSCHVNKLVKAGHLISIISERSSMRQLWTPEKKLADEYKKEKQKEAKEQKKDDENRPTLPKMSFNKFKSKMIDEYAGFTFSFKKGNELNYINGLGMKINEAGYLVKIIDDEEKNIDKDEAMKVWSYLYKNRDVVIKNAEQQRKQGMI